MDNYNLLIIFWIIFYYLLFLFCDKILGSIKCIEAGKYASYINSFVHAIISSCYALYIVIDMYNNGTLSKFVSNHPSFNTFVPITIGYFLVDLCYIFRHDKSHTKYIVHHIFFTIMLYWLMYINKYHGLACIVIVIELSTIILNVHHYYAYMKFYHKNNESLRTYYCHKAEFSFKFFAIIFFMVRVVLLVICGVYYFPQMYKSNIFLIFAHWATIVLNLLWLVTIKKKFLNYPKN